MLRRIASIEGIAIAGALLFFGSDVTNAQSFDQDRSRAMNGNAEAQYLLAQRYDFGNDVTADTSEAIVWYKLAASQGHTDAMYNLGITYQYGDRVDVDINEAIGWYEAAGNRGHGDSQYSLAEILSEEGSEWSNYSEAMRWYQRAADNGIPDALVGLGNMHADGLGVVSSVQIAARMYYDAALMGNTRGQALYGLSLLTGQGVTVNKRGLRMDAFGQVRGE